MLGLAIGYRFCPLALGSLRFPVVVQPALVFFSVFVVNGHPAVRTFAPPPFGAFCDVNSAKTVCFP